MFLMFLSETFYHSLKIVIINLKDSDREIEKIEYNLLNLPTKIFPAGANLQFVPHK